VFVIFAAFATLVVAPASAQNSSRHVTTIDALRRFSGYFHLQNVVLRGEFVEVAAGRGVNGSTRSGGGAADVSATGKRIALRSGDTEMQVILNDDNPVDG